ncbi:hypothetical protein EGW08_012116, partial [Elysia chlorotica]
MKGIGLLTAMLAGVLVARADKPFPTCTEHEAERVPTCPFGQYIEGSGLCVLAETRAETWQAAKQNCQSRSPEADMAFVRDENMDWVLSIVLRRALPLGQQLWAELEMTDTDAQHPLGWVEIDAQWRSQHSWTDFRDAECLTKSSSVGTWRPEPCNATRGYICTVRVRARDRPVFSLRVEPVHENVQDGHLAWHCVLRARARVRIWLAWGSSPVRPPSNLLDDAEQEEIYMTIDGVCSRYVTVDQPVRFLSGVNQSTVACCGEFYSGY